jgi:hypothetical protein
MRIEANRPIPSIEELTAQYGDVGYAKILQKVMQDQQEEFKAQIAQSDGATKAPVNTLSNPPATALSTASATELSTIPVDYMRIEANRPIPSIEELTAQYGDVGYAKILQKVMQDQQEEFKAQIAQSDGATKAPVNTLSNPPVTALSTASATELSNTPTTATTATPVTTPVTTTPVTTPVTTTPVTTPAPAGGRPKPVTVPTDTATATPVTTPQSITIEQLNSALNTQQASSSKAYNDALQAQQAASSKAYNDALQANQTALTTQNADFLKNWNTSADALKTNILSGVDAKNQAFGTQATQGFMDAFKNFQIPTNQQNGVNMGNYNDNRNAAADQWWSQYVTGRR